MSTAADQAYHQLHPVEAVVDAWVNPSPFGRHLNPSTRREIIRLSPDLGRALDRLAKHDPPVNRQEMTDKATKSVAESLARLFNENPVGHRDSDPERWRKAVEIVDRLVRAGLI